jgi:lipopolysaccharide export system protein LptA
MKIMKQFIYLLAFAFMNVNASAQQNVPGELTIINGLKVTVNANKLQINWKSNKTEDAAYWEVQASADGKSFSTIGMVMGADPTTGTVSEGDFTFKQQTSKIKPGMKYFRVLHIETADMAMASNTIQFTK